MMPTHSDGDVVDELVERLRAERALLERVLVALPDITAGLDTTRIREGIAELALDLCGAEFGLLVSTDEDETTGTWTGQRLAEPPSVWRAPLLAAAFRGGPVVRIDDVARWARTEQAAAQYGSFTGGRLVRSYLVAPVADRRGEIIAALFVGHHRPQAFRASHERLLEAMARFLASALENAEHLHERDRVAEGLQQTLLPPLLPVIPGVDLAARYRAAFVDAHVGGDFYDVFVAGDARWGAIIGDVCGTGPEAAAVTGIARYTVRALAATSKSPASTMDALNTALVQQRVDRRFLTATHLLFSVVPDDGIEVDIARAGHPPSAVLRTDGAVELLEKPRGTLLGVFDEATVEDGFVHLGLGDALVLYTDGLVEARAPGSKEQLGYERLADLLTSSAGRTADGIARRLEAAAEDWSGGDIIDDVAILVLRAV